MLTFEQGRFGISHSCRSSCAPMSSFVFLKSAILISCFHSLYSTIAISKAKAATKSSTNAASISDIDSDVHANDRTSTNNEAETEDNDTEAEASFNDTEDISSGRFILFNYHCLK